MGNFKTQLRIYELKRERFRLPYWSQDLRDQRREGGTSWQSFLESFEKRTDRESRWRRESH